MIILLVLINKQFNVYLAISYSRKSFFLLKDSFCDCDDTGIWYSDLETTKQSKGNLKCWTFNSAI